MNGRLPVRSIVLGLLLSLGILSGCGLLPEAKDETGNWNVERIYQTGREAVQEGNYLRAIKMFESLESRFPYGVYAQQALLQQAYANYKLGEMTAAVSAADRFIKQYPNHVNADYAYYLRGLANFNEDFGLLTWVADQDLSERDPKTLRESFNSFRDLAAKFPESRYAADSRARMRFLVNALASGEVHVSRYYYNRGAYVAAASRAQQAVVTYPNAPAVEDALWLMVASYDKLNLPELRDDAKRILERNFPKSAYLTGDSHKSWWKFW
ncbi:MAG: outer membrane protein assembly factor BamD [Betaproteobacteria bacterium]